MKKFELLGRKTAEIASFFLSAGTIIGLLIYLGVAHFKRHETSYLKLKAEVLRDGIKQVGDSFVVPIKIKNLGEKTPTKARFRIEVNDGAEKFTQEIDVEYLSRLSSKTVYWVHHKNVIDSDIKVTSESYQF
jgi:uncharacterized protein (TIGR02588 family)